jgi:hypothetical protein
MTKLTPKVSTALPNPPYSAMLTWIIVGTAKAPMVMSWITAYPPPFVLTSVMMPLCEPTMRPTVATGPTGP